jgi:flagellar biosynthetic protein FliR
MDLSQINSTTVMAFLLMVIRIVGLLITAPLFSHRAVPVMVTAWLSVLIAFLVAPFHLKHIAPSVALLVHDIWGFAWMAVQEFAIGAILGFIASLAFTGIEMAGTIVTQQMGLAMVQALNPFFNTQTQGLGQFYFVLAAFIFFSMDVHHSLIIAATKSFDWVPVAHGIAQGPQLVGRLMALGSLLFSMALMFTLPILGTLLVVEVALAYVSKVMPQMNVFMVSLPLKVTVGFLLIAMTLPFCMKVANQSFSDAIQHMMTLYHLKPA